MRTVDLVPGPNVRAMDLAVETLSLFGLRPEDYAIGGGTVLAARWMGHRISEDIDLFAEKVPIEEAIKRAGGEEEVKARLATLGFEKPKSGKQEISWESEHGPISIFFSKAPPVPQFFEEVESRHGVRMERTASILAKKLHFRMFGHNNLVNRDAYDLIASAHMEPEALKEAMATLRVDRRHIIADGIESFDFNKSPFMAGRDPLHGRKGSPEGPEADPRP